MGKHNKILPILIAIIFIFIGLFYLFGESSINKRVIGAGSIRSFNLTATADYSNSSNPNVALDWSDFGTGVDTIFKGYQSTDGGETWENISLMDYSSVTRVNVLNVYPEEGDGLKSWMETSTDSISGEVIGKNIIKVTKVGISDFNRNPSNYLKKTGSEWNYDVVVFGFWDRNNWYDISDSAKTLIDSYIGEGKGVVFGHDTALNNSFSYVDTKIFSSDTVYKAGQTNFSYLAEKYLPMHWHEGIFIGSTTVKITKKGLLTQYPWDLGPVGTTYTIPSTHTWGQVLDDTSNVWMNFDGVEETVAGSNFYVVSNNNVSMIMTGHTNGESTEAEQKILANLLFYNYQLTFATNVTDYSGMDLASPSIPVVDITGDYSNVHLSFSSTDNGSTYHYYIEGYNKIDMTTVTARSNVASATVIAGLKGFYYIIDTNENIDFSNTSATFTTNDEIDLSGSYLRKYLHIKAVDLYNNESSVKTYQINLNQVNTILDLDGGVIDGEGENILSSYINETITIPTPTRENYMFSTWNKENSCTSTLNNNQITTVDSCELKAIWIPDFNHNNIDDTLDPKITIQYRDGCDHEAFEDVVLDDVLIGVDTPSFDGAPTRRNYLFVGWNPDIEDETTTDVIYEAVWEEDMNNNGVPDKDEKKYKITFKDGLNNQVFTEFTIEVLEGTKIPDFDQNLLKNDFYEFRGWDSPIDIVASEDKTFTAQWNLIIHNVPDTKYRSNSLLYFITFIIFFGGVICLYLAIKRIY